MSNVIADNPPPLVSYSYDLAGNRTGKTYENGTSATYVYDDANRLTSITKKAFNVTFASFAYAYNGVNNRTAVTRETGRGDVYSYDSIDQLIGVQYEATTPSTSPPNPSHTQGFMYDVAGNRTGVSENGVTNSYTVNTLNEYTSIDSVAPTYDANGNQTSGAVAGWTYTYDAQNRLIRAQSPPGSNQTTFTFVRDGRNRCVKRVTVVNNIAGEDALCLIYDDWSLIEDQHKGNADQEFGEQARYINGAKIDEIVARIDSNGPLYFTMTR